MQVYRDAFADHIQLSEPSSPSDAQLTAGQCSTVQDAYETLKLLQRTHRRKPPKELRVLARVDNHWMVHAVLGLVHNLADRQENPNEPQSDQPHPLTLLVPRPDASDQERTGPIAILGTQTGAPAYRLGPSQPLTAARICQPA